MTEVQNPKRYDLEERTLAFAKKAVELVNKLPKNVSNFEISKQFIRAAGSVGANYIEANESLSKRDFVLRIKICRKEAKESRYWLYLIVIKPENKSIHEKLIQESSELMKIFGSILGKCK